MGFCGDWLVGKYFGYKNFEDWILGIEDMGIFWDLDCREKCPPQTKPP